VSREPAFAAVSRCPNANGNSIFALETKVSMRIRIVLPHHLRKLAQVGAELELDVDSPITQRSVLDALEACYPMLRGTIREHGTQKRRPFLRFFACNQDYSLDPPETPLPTAVVTGEEPFLIVGAIAGG
jgi:hypothetical protein